jgi:hypothetical protein
MGDRRQERQRQRRREALERAMAGLEGGAECLDAGPFFLDHGELVEGLREVLGRAGLLEASLALARHLEDDRDLWLRRLALLDQDPRLRARRAALEADYLEVLGGHFSRWSAGGPQGERAAAIEAGCALAALRGAERLWLQGQGRPLLPVLVEEALALLWPALYGHVRRHLK